MDSQPLSDDVLNDTSGFPDSSAPEPKADEPLELTDDQALDDSLAEAAPDAEAGEPEKPENPVEKRIKGALKARDDAKNELANERAAKAELEKRLAAIEARMTPEKPAEAAAAEETAPDPKDFEFGGIDPQYLEALAEHKASIKVKEAFSSLESQFQQQQEQQAAQARAEKQIEAAKEIVAKGVALYDDFEEVVWERGLREEYKLSETAFEAIQETSHPAEITYALASDPAEAQRVFDMTLAQQVKYILEKEAEFAGKTTRVTKAPPPPGQQVRGSSGRYTVAPDTDDLDAFEKEFFKKK